MDSFGEVFLSADMEESEESCCEDPDTQVSQVLGRRATLKRKQEEAFKGASPPQHNQAKEASQRSPKPKKERPQANEQIGEAKVGLPQTSSPKPRRESVKSKARQETSSKTRISGSSEVSSSGGAQQPSPMSRVTRLEPSSWAKAVSASYPDNQHAKKSDCGCHTCIRELAVIKHQPTDRKGSFSTWFKDRVGSLHIYFQTDPKSHPESCLCKTHLEEEWALLNPKNRKAPIPQPTTHKRPGVVSTLLKKLDPSRTGGMTRQPLSVDSAGNRASGTSRTPHQDLKQREPNVTTGKREDARTGRPPPPQQMPKPEQAKVTATPVDSEESKTTNIPVHTTR